MEQNRSDQAESPKSKIVTPEDLLNSFVQCIELEGFECGYKDLNSMDNVLIFADAARKRLLRIYDAWYGPDGLDINKIV